MTAFTHRQTAIHRRLLDPAEAFPGLAHSHVLCEQSLARSTRLRPRTIGQIGDLVFKRLISVTRQCDLDCRDQVGVAERLDDELSHGVACAQSTSSAVSRERGEQHNGARQLPCRIFRMGDAIHLRI